MLKKLLNNISNFFAQFLQKNWAYNAINNNIFLFRTEKGMHNRKISQKYIFINRVRATAVLIVWWFFCGMTAVFSEALAVLLGLLSIFVYIFFISYYLTESYSAYSYTVGKHSIDIKKGFFIRKKIHLDRSRIQYCEQFQSPLQRIMGTCTVAYQVAGAVVYLSQIDIADVNGVMFR